MHLEMSDISDFQPVMEISASVPVIDIIDNSYLRNSGLSNMGWDLKDSVKSPTEWRNLGLKFAKSSANTQWGWGDWAIFGENTYGKMRKMIADPSWKEAGGPAYQSIANSKSVAKAFPPERRRPNLHWGHHEVVRSLPEASQEEFLNWAERTGASIRALKEALEDKESEKPLKSKNPGKRLIQKIKNSETLIEMLQSVLSKEIRVSPDELKHLASEARHLGAMFTGFADDVANRRPNL
jgi:hypothetical protein